MEEQSGKRCNGKYMDGLVSKDLLWWILPIFGLNLNNEWFEPEKLAEIGAYVLISESGESIFEISIREYDAHVTEMN